MIEERIYWTLEDFYDNLFDSYLVYKAGLEIGNAVKISSDTLFKLLVAELTTATVSSPFTTDEVNNLFCTYIYPKYKNMVVCYGSDYTELNNNSFVFWRHLLNRIRTSYDEYKLLIDALSNEKNNLLNPIVNQTKFNDTPQTQTTAGVTSYDDRYNTNVSTNYNDGATKIARIAEIELLIKDYYEKWCNTVCKGLFIYE